MNCTNCGGPAELVGGKDFFRCAYCSSYTFPPESDEGVRSHSTAAGARCPACRVEMLEASVEGVAVRFCEKCRGILVHPPEFRRVLERRAAKEPRAVRQPERISEEELARQVSCPYCAVTMSVHPYYGPGNAVIDTCDECLALWLDHSELTVIVEAARLAN